MSQGSKIIIAWSQSVEQHSGGMQEIIDTLNTLPREYDIEPIGLGDLSSSSSDAANITARKPRTAENIIADHLRQSGTYAQTVNCNEVITKILQYGESNNFYIILTELPISNTELPIFNNESQYEYRYKNVAIITLGECLYDTIDIFDKTVAAMLERVIWQLLGLGTHPYGQCVMADFLNYYGLCRNVIVPCRRIYGNLCYDCQQKLIRITSKHISTQ